MSLIRRTPGRLSDVRVTGPEDGPVLVFHHGTPGSASGYRVVEGPAHERGLRVVWMSRPGYGDSSRQRGRRVVDVVSDTAEVLDALGVDTCLVGGGSSGGPHALACAARLDAAQAVLVVSSHAPFDAEGLDYLAGMGDTNLSVYGAALDGEETLRRYLDADRERLLGVNVGIRSRPVWSVPLTLRPCLLVGGSRASLGPVATERAGMAPGSIGS
jgi:pimeloyl-ACP methyl ester carboxylesterase